METYFVLEDFAKSMLLSSNKKKDKELWQHILELNEEQAKYLYIN